MLLTISAVPANGLFNINRLRTSAVIRIMIPNTEIAAIPSIILKKRSRHRSNFLRTDISSHLFSLLSVLSLSF